MIQPKNILFLMFFCATIAVAQTKTSDNNYQGTILETMNRIEQIFDIKVVDDRHLLDNKTLDFSDWRIEPGNLELSLANILAPFGLTYFKQANGTYQIRKYEHYKVSVDKAKNRLAFLSTQYAEKTSWEDRKTALMSCVKYSLGLDKAPKRPNSKPILTKKRKFTGYTVENIGLEILPGIYTTGSIYKPFPLKNKSAVILMPNGHFGDGRYRASEQIRAANLARMDAIVVTFDLFAWGESQLQFPAATHRNSIASTIQVLSGMRLLDYVATLKYADMTRVGVTGGSGGGSHTMFLAALDDRITVSVPVVMVSAHFSGGCPCESGRGIHLCGNGTNNAEIAAMAAPKPQLIISDGKDWTHTVPELEFPFIQRTYGFYGKTEQIENVHFESEGHDYGTSKRLALYPFMAKHLRLGIEKIKNKLGEIDESKSVVEPYSHLFVFGDHGEKLPKNAINNIDDVYKLFDEENPRKYEESFKK